MIVTATGLLALTALAATGLKPGEPPIAAKARLLTEAIEVAQKDLIDTAPAYEDHSTWANAWQIETEHYVIRLTHSRHLGLELGQDLETMFAWFQDLFGTDWQPPQRLQVHIYPSLAEYNQFGNSINADEHSSFYGAFYAVQDPARPAAVMYSANIPRLKMHMTHAVLHQFVGEAFTSQPPYWVSEGLASYFSLFFNYPYLQREHRRLAESDQFIPLRILASAAPTNFADRHHDKLMELGALFNYLLWRRPDTMTVVDEDGEVVQAPVRDLIRAAVRGNNLGFNPTYLSLMGRLDEIEADFKAYTFAD